MDMALGNMGGGEGMGIAHVQGWDGAQDPQAGPCLPPTGQR